MKIFQILSLWTGTKSLKTMSKYEFSVMHGSAKVKKILVLHWTLKIEYPSPEMILTGEVAQWSDAERTKDDADAVLVKQGRRAGTGMAHGRRITERGDARQKWSRQTAATAQRHTAFRKTQTPSASSLTERPTLSVVMCCKLYMCLYKLPPEERKLINRIYFLGYSLRQLSAETGIPYMTIQHRKVKILAKLKKFMENWKPFRAATVWTRL